MRPRLESLLIVSTIALLPFMAFAQNNDNQEQAQFKALFRELVEIDTSHTTGNTTRGVEAAARYLRQAGFEDKDLQIFEPFPGKGNLVARLRGDGSREPLLVVSHLDVVDASAQEWGRDPFKLLEKDGQYYARGVLDDKPTAAVYLSILGQLKREGYRSSRDIILALTSDEERHDVPSNGVFWLTHNHPELLRAEFAMIQGGSGELRKGKPALMRIGVAQKNYLSTTWQARNTGGHSSAPRGDNAIYELSSALLRLQTYRFPASASATVRPYLAHSAPFATGQLAADLQRAGTGVLDGDTAERLSQSPVYNALLRTTCVATRLESDGPENALPQFVRATVNCRVLPGESLKQIEQTLVQIAGPGIEVQRLKGTEGALSSSTDNPLYRAIEKTVHTAYPDVVSVPWLTAGSTDARHLRTIGIPTYGFLGVFADPDKPWNAHGVDENINIAQLVNARVISLALLKDLTEH
ncbi:M20/M25/M40 family metallo-hydrolase [Pseudomonas sp. D5002]|uniref:M20/M25/M40 family metallo-hydrolase n=1 Tax=Pseudomonas sp. D5002 TaxID=2738818 RepID=UPI0015A48DD5|nr:M20/M25/M40 family metallo-hydrolase [Pseudomonas sp. D5002]NWB09093.1 M20/M25/M40 family metallo-hydrolase [Pseudomonas sp. D5002]